jgi:hypothetical protein
MKHALDPSKMEPLLGSYESVEVPAWYSCYCCGARGVRLWREYNTFLNHQTLLCAACSEAEQDKEPGFAMRDGDQIGWRIPAVPAADDDTYWGYSSVPTAGAAWWHSLALRADDPVDAESSLRRKVDWLLKTLQWTEKAYLREMRANLSRS